MLEQRRISNIEIGSKNPVFSQTVNYSYVIVPINFVRIVTKTYQVLTISSKF